MSEKAELSHGWTLEGFATGGYAYVDKTDMLWKLANGKNGTLFFISRPRRFGKSLMLSTLKYLFQGKKKLFKGLKIGKKRWDWSQTYPVVGTAFHRRPRRQDGGSPS